MSETPQDCDLPPAKKLKRDESCDLPKSGTDSKFANDKYEDFVSPEELEKLKEFQVLDEVRSNDEDSNDDDSEMSDGKSDGLPEDEIEKMLEEDLPEGFKGAPKPKERPYITRQKIVLEEKGVNYYEVLPLDWMMVRHYSGMPVYVHRTTRVCTLSKPYFLGKGNTRRHDIPISAIPCLSYRKALEEEKKQKEIDKRIAEQIRSGNWVVNSADNNGDKESVANASNGKTNAINNVDDRNENVGTTCPFKFSDTINADKVVLNNDGDKNDSVEQTLASETTNEDKLTKINLLNNEGTKPSLSKIENTFTLHNEDSKKNLLAKMMVDSEAIKMGTEATKMGTEATKMGSEATKMGTEATKMGTEAAQKTLAEENEKQCNSNKTKQAEPVTKKEVSNETNEDESEHSQDEQVLNTEGVNEGCEVPEAAGQRPVVLPGGVVMPPPRVETVATSWKTQHLTPEQVNEYCKRLFKFNTVNIMHFMRWADRRKYTKARKTLQYPTLPEGTKLITIPAAPANGQDNGAKTNKRDWVLNMNGRSYLSVFHEYVRRALQKQPVYEFVQLENAATPYQATVYIGGMQYGVGHGSSKRQAKSAAARASIHILIPEMKDELDAGTSAQEPDFSFFDYVGIEDPRITEFCAATCEPSPHAILRTCLLRNFGATDRHISTEMKKLEFQKIELTMKVGKHSATVVCKNKKTAKQRASQAILQALHPHVRSWGSLLRLYGSRSVKSCKEKKLEEQQITLLQDKARHNEPNYAVLEKLRHEMGKLRERDAACAPIGTLLLAAALPTHSGANLNNVEL
ncbi:microprocessor complex subunit DGCR8 [Ostrinia nubilalis]|uniref:microprocessor complex subunit DGCR8 n=1 Tax=Ostrinia nubilalis TaxID=29057 RepID=UPI00308231BC